MFFAWKRAKPIRDLEEGVEVIVEGRVLSQKELTIPNSATKCVYFYQFTEAWEHGVRGAGRKMWVPKTAVQKCDGFYIDDGEGKMWVEGGAPMDVSGGREEAGEIGKKGKGRYHARFIGNGDTVRIGGLVDRSKGSEPGDVKVLRPGRKGVLKVLFKKS